MIDVASEILRPARTAPPPDQSIVPFILMMGIMLILFVGMFGLVFFIISYRGKEVRERANLAFNPLGIAGARYIMMSWRGTGYHQGRGVTITVMAGQRRSPPSMFVELVSSSRFDLSISPPVGTAGRWLRDKLTSGVEIASPNVPGLTLYTNDPSRATTTADGAAAHVRRIMTPLSLGQQRYVYIRPGVVKLQVIGDAWQTLTAQSARADLDDLVAIAHAAERY